MERGREEEKLAQVLGMRMGGKAAICCLGKP